MPLRSKLELKLIALRNEAIQQRARDFFVPSLDSVLSFPCDDLLPELLAWERKLIEIPASVLQEDPEGEPRRNWHLKSQEYRNALYNEVLRRMKRNKGDDQ